ncbi:hypothetical protein HHI36_008597 [Cryptolaemus montrouzieri]|uniref:Uncharacterized protein n=1 Tax=Cryptolaemus montrouzieri TaxID=559131 RepID=A0ABD2MTU6_9CUCU
MSQLKERLRAAMNNEVEGDELDRKSQNEGELDSDDEISKRENLSSVRSEKDKISGRNHKVDVSRRGSNRNNDIDSAKVNRCKNCGVKGNMRFECLDKEKEGKGIKCFNDIKITALIDIGCDFTLIRTAVYVNIGFPPPLRTRIDFDDIGSKANDTLREFVVSDNEKYDEYPETRDVVNAYKPVESHEIGNKMNIILKHDIPVYTLPSLIASQEGEEISAIVQFWIEKEKTRPSDSEHTRPIVLVKKKG